MSTKDEVLRELEEHKGIPVSGGNLSKLLGLSRGAVWKAIESLRAEGYQIEAVTNTGYTLLPDNDLLSSEGILLHLKSNEVRREQLFPFKSLESTNQLAKKMAVEGAAHGTVILAEEQTAGRGRLGRSFYSPKGSGLYMSLILRPTGNASQALSVTTAASVAVCLALSQTYGIEAEIKWVNDIFYRGKKICGILAEAVSDFQTGTIEALVLGIGLNIHAPKEGFPKELEEIAGAVFHRGLEEDANRNQQKASRNELAAALIDRVLAIYQNLGSEEIQREYKNRCFILGKDIVVYRGNDEFPARAIDIDSEGGLIVVTQAGNQEVLRSGEISIRTVPHEKGQ